MTTSLGLSAGSGMIHCVLLTTDEAGRTHTVNRVIDVDPTDGLTRAGRVNSGIDLMLGTARDNNTSVATIGVAYRTDEQAREIASRGTGAKRQIHLVAETEAIAHHLISAGEINRFTSVVVVDLGDTGMSLYTIDPATRRIGDHRRSTAVSGDSLDALLAAELTTSGKVRGRRKSSVLSACRTAKEELSVRDSTSMMMGNPAFPVPVTRTVLERLARPMASAAADEVAAYVEAERATRPEAVVLVGGLANIPLLRDLITERSGLEPILPHSPESVAARGAATLAATGITGSTLAFIGGRRNRDWLSAAPLAVFGALLAGALMTVYAVGSSLAGNPSTPSAPPSSVTAEAEATTTSTPPPEAGESRVIPTVTSPQQQISITAAPPPATVGNTGGAGTGTGTGGGNQDPGWATTELPAPSGPTEQPSTSTLSTSLWPFPIPSITWPPLGQLPPTAPGSTTIVPPVTSPPPPTAPPAEGTSASPAPQQQSVPTTQPAG
ncbi:Hsp70 family protein [Williamsia soli]|uniref:Hsp70 family protein n=1 Tax=Williamsia soli TaxID=364929 RepID=UPI001A9F3C90|nr:Hsp70 family protein [Williamsia soli]